MFATAIVNAVLAEAGCAFARRLKARVARRPGARCGYCQCDLKLAEPASLLRAALTRARRKKRLTRYRGYCQCDVKLAEAGFNFATRPKARAP